MLVPTMGITLAICRLSPKREAMLREDPTLVWELSREVSGYLVVGKAWDALRVAVQPFDAVVSKLFAGSLGKSFGEPGAFGKPRIMPNAEVRQVALAMTNVPARFVADRLESLRGVDVHGRFFDFDREDPALLAELPELAALNDKDEGDALAQNLEATFAQARALVAQAAERGDSLLVVFR